MEDSICIMDSNDRAVLRRLAQDVAEIAARPLEQEKRRLWYDHNALKPTRPPIYCDPEGGWSEVILDKDIECSSDLARQWEWTLRREIFWGRQMGDDRVTLPVFNIDHVASDSGWGMSERYIGGANRGAYVWESPISSYDCLDQLRYPKITVDWEATNRRVEAAKNCFGDVLAVLLKTEWFWTVGLTWTLIKLRGLEQIMYDMADEPQNLHRLMAFLRDGTMAMLDDLEDQGLLSLNNDGTYVGSGAFGWSNELPASDFAGRVRHIDRWGLCESQETVGVSPDMFAEFVLPYQMPLVTRFGLACYGCCEPLELRWKYVQTIPNLRRVSVPPAANRAVMAAHLEDKYIYSMKPNPADLAVPTFDEDRIRKALRDDLAAARGCCLEIVMKDIHTIGGHPNRVVRWVQIAKRRVQSGQRLNKPALLRLGLGTSPIRPPKSVLQKSAS